MPKSSGNLDYNPSAERLYSTFQQLNYSLLEVMYVVTKMKCVKRITTNQPLLFTFGYFLGIQYSVFYAVAVEMRIGHWFTIVGYKTTQLLKCQQPPHDLF
jgi:hypothetical protein